MTTPHNGRDSQITKNDETRPTGGGPKSQKTTNPAQRAGFLKEALLNRCSRILLRNFFGIFEDLIAIVVE